MLSTSGSYNELNFIRTLQNKLDISKNNLADLLGVSYRTLHRWIGEKTSQPSRLAKQFAMKNIKEILAILGEALPEDEIYNWLNNYNKFLNGRKPKDLLIEQKYNKVLDAALDLRDNII